MTVIIYISREGPPNGQGPDSILMICNVLVTSPRVCGLEDRTWPI